MNYKIRKVKIGDETVLAEIQTESWKAAFNNILSEEALSKCTEINNTIAMYRRLLEQHKGNGYILEVDEKPHCIAWWDTIREKDIIDCAEIICIHSLPNNWGKGYGGKMMDKLIKDISDGGYSKVVLWVFNDNKRARKFYEAKGFTATKEMRESLDVLEICYERCI